MRAAVSLDEILTRPDIWRGGAGASAMRVQPSGFAPLDAELPGGGWPCGALTEILHDGTGLGECTLLLPALARLGEEGKWTLLVAPPHALHGPAWAAQLDLTRLAVVAPSGAPRIRNADALWATEQALASGAFGAVLCWSRQIDAGQVRRLQVAATAGGALAFLFRSCRVRSEASAAALRLVLSVAPGGRLAVELLKRRGSPCVRKLAFDVARPCKVHDDHGAETRNALAGAASARAAARGARPAVVA